MEREHQFRGVDGPRKEQVVRYLARALDVLLGVTGLATKAAQHAARLQLTAFEVVLHDLPVAFDGYRLLHVSDLHADVSPRAVETLSAVVRRLSVDLLVATGDFAQHPQSAKSAAREMGCLARQVAARDGALAILGNHDSWLTADALEAEGIRVLVNETVTLEREGQCIAVTGTDDPSHFFSEAAVEALRIRTNATRIALIHSPELAGIAADAGVGLYLCGHTHGGQIQIPLVGYTVNPLRRHREYLRGYWRHAQMIGYTSRGVGTSMAALRIDCPAEVTIITLRRSDGP
jgi:uncharacterized protein